MQIVSFCFVKTHNASVSDSVEIREELELDYRKCDGKNALSFICGAPILPINSSPPSCCIPARSDKHVVGVAHPRLVGLCVQEGKLGKGT